MNEKMPSDLSAMDAAADVFAAASISALHTTCATVIAGVLESPAPRWALVLLFVGLMQLQLVRAAIIRWVKSR